MGDHQRQASMGPVQAGPVQAGPVLAGPVLAGPVLAGPLLMLCWLCCWSDGDSSDGSTSGAASQYRIAVTTPGRSAHELSTRSRGVNCSVTSLHLPTTSGHTKQPLSAHRSHEEFGRRRRSHHDTIASGEGRYHSAPSVIDEILHRRSWERSNKDLYKEQPPSRNDADSGDSSSTLCPGDPAPNNDNDNVIESNKQKKADGKPCKKHFANIKSSTVKTINANKEAHASVRRDDDVKSKITHENVTSAPKQRLDNLIYENNPLMLTWNDTKQAKQSINESIRKNNQVFTFKLNKFDEHLVLDELMVDKAAVTPADDRSGAVHHSIESRISLNDCISRLMSLPPASVEPVDYSGGACYLPGGGQRGVGGAGWAGGEAPRARVASDGDILAPHVRPQSGAFSESDVEWETSACDEPPPTQPRPSTETAI